MIVAALAMSVLTVVTLVFRTDSGAVPSESDVAARIQNLRTLAVTEYRYRDVIYFGEESRFLGLPAGSREILFSVVISVTAGVDLNRGIDVQIDSSDTGKVFVTLPAPEIVRVDAEERSISQYFVRERFGRLDWLAVSDEVEAAKERNTVDAIDRGILAQAERQARAAVQRLLQAGGFSGVTVRFRPSVPRVTG